MSALILLALAALSFVAFASLSDSRSPLLREVAEGMTKASAVFFFTLLVASIAVFVLSVSMDTEVAAMRLRDIEAELHFVQAWRARILGSWDWRLVLGFVGIGVAGILFALEELAGRVLWALRRVKIVGAVLALLASLTISTVPAEDALRDLELRYARATDAMASDARTIEDLAALQARQSAIDAVQEAVLFCNDPSRPVCRRFDGLHSIPPHAWLTDDARLSGIWEGTYSWTDAPDDAAAPKWQSVALAFTTRRSMLADTTPGDLYMRRLLLGQRALSWRIGMGDDARRALLNLAVDAGYETAIEAAHHAGASGSIVEALLMPLVASPLKALLERLTQDAMSRALSGQASLTDIDDQVQTRVSDAIKNGDTPFIERAVNTSADVLSAAETMSGQALIDARQRQDDRDANARANYSGGAPTLGGGFVGIPYNGNPVGTGTSAPYGGPPATVEPGRQGAVVH